MKEENKKYTLIKDGEGEFSFIDQDGVSHDSPQDWLWSFLGGCGCGSSEYFSEEAMKVFKHFAKPNSERTLDVYENELYELLAHWMDSVGLLEHGTNVAGSWLSEKGENIYEEINKF